MIRVNLEDRAVDEAIENGADATLLIDRQGEIKSQRELLASRLEEVEAKRDQLPDVEATEQQAQALRLRMVFDHKDKDWRTLEFDDIRSFLR